MSLVPVREEERDEWLHAAAPLLDVSNIWHAACFIQGCSCCSLANLITQGNECAIMFGRSTDTAVTEGTLYPFTADKNKPTPSLTWSFEGD